MKTHSGAAAPKGYRDPMLRQFYDTIRSLRQAQRRTIKQACQTFRTWDATQDELDRMACDGLIRSAARHRITRTPEGRFALSLADNLHN